MSNYQKAGIFYDIETNNYFLQFIPQLDNTGNYHINSKHLNRLPNFFGIQEVANQLKAEKIEYIDQIMDRLPYETMSGKNRGRFVNISPETLQPYLNIRPKILEYKQATKTLVEKVA